MIKTSTQLKALVKNYAHSDNKKALLWFRNYAMERLLERISLSPYRDCFILKGGMLVSSMVGLDSRSTMDMDATIRDFTLDEENISRIIKEITEIPLDDNMRFEIKQVSAIMDEADYPGIRLAMNAYLDTMRISMKVDISTGDAITPAAVEYQYKAMFDERYFTLWAYNLETVLAEKIETMLTRGVLNTRLRDFYDLYILQNSGMDINDKILQQALLSTCKKRGSMYALESYHDTIEDLLASDSMMQLWNNYRAKNDYTGDLDWITVVLSARDLCIRCIQPEKRRSFEPAL